uniref:Ribosome binding protein 1 n=1 Tax=Podarcis muralis TaxID=64176 RepID=A0A670IG33_PODMU
MVFGGFMLVSAVGIFLVSTFSMKETSFEEALAKQRKELEKASHHKVEKKKKEKPAEKKGRAKKKEEKPNGVLEPDAGLDASDGSPEPVFEAPIVSLPAPEEKPTLSPKDKKKKEKKVGKVESVPSLAASSPPITASKDLVSDVVSKEVSVAAAPLAAAQQNAPLTNSVSVKKPQDLRNREEQRHDGASNKKSTAPKKKESSTTDVENMLYVPYKTLCSIICSMVFGEGEAQQLIEILTEKAGGAQHPWLMATQKGDPVAVLKRQLEDREKQLATEQENVTVAKAKLRELSKELTAEKAKALSVENKLKEQLKTREQEVTALQARMQASYQDRETETQQLQGKIRTLQEQLENGPNTQLARLQQENSILRDALNQATSQTESKQNAELAKLRQECSRLGKELTEKLGALQQVEEQKKVLETKVAASEEQIRQLQISQKEKEAPLQKSLEEMGEELSKSQASYQSLQKELAKAKEQQSSLAELQSKLLHSEMMVKTKAEELNSLQIKLSEATSKNAELAERIQSAEALLEAGQMREAEKNKDVQVRVLQCPSLLASASDNFASFSGVPPLYGTLLKQHGIITYSLPHWPTLASSFAFLYLFVYSLKLLYKYICAAYHTDSDFGILNFVAFLGLGLMDFLAAFNSGIESTQEANEAMSALQAECDQYRTILAETERMLKDLQKSVEEEEQVWKAKLIASEEALQKVLAEGESSCCSPSQLENHLATANSERQNYMKEVEHVSVCETFEFLGKVYPS